MDVAVSLIGTFMLLMLSVYRGINILYPLFIGLLIFIAVAYKRGYKPKELISMIMKGIRKSVLIISIMMLIGAIMSVWRASGTVAYVVYYGIRFVDPNLFI
ncbi:MAG TPA: Na+/H+ antiporter NhaC family protein, partial [Candidatus Diapherotrites archaeon]|nr:Na+/H+ antiporter NhaC family protein [Candidatus Diapherotrites archaeon]